MPADVMVKPATNACDRLEMNVITRGGGGGPRSRRIFGVRGKVQYSPAAKKI